MTAMQVAERMTAEQFLAEPERERGWPVSLVEGEVVMNDPTRLHGAVQKAILLALERWIAAGTNRGVVTYPHDVGLDAGNVYKPDVLWYAHGRVPSLSRRPPYAMPDLAVEVRSPSTWRYEIGAKKAGYERHGLPELWLVDTAAEAVMVFRRSRPGAPTFDIALECQRSEQITSPLLPGLQLQVDEVFPTR